MIIRLKQWLASRYAVLDYIRRMHRLPKTITIPQEFEKCIQVSYPLYLLDVKSKIEGEVCEFGVYQGITFRRLCNNYPNQIILGFDSFRGLPETWTETTPVGTFKTNPPPIAKNAKLIKGLFNETLPSFVKTLKNPIAFAHIDSDLYSSASTILQNLKPHFVCGSLILFDEFFGWCSEWKNKGESLALKESGIECVPTHVCVRGNQVLFKVINNQGVG